MLLPGVWLGLALAAGLLADRAEAREVYEQPWFEARTPNFTIVSASSRDDTADIARQFERLRYTVRAMTLERGAENVPTEVYVFPAQFSELDLTKDSSSRVRYGFRAIVLMSVAVDLESLQYSYLRVYARIMLRSREALNLPLWFETGFTDMITDAHVKRGQAVVGWTPDSTPRILVHTDWIDSKELISRGSGSDPSACGEKCRSEWQWQFDTQSWLLTHYLMFEKGAGIGLNVTMNRYLSLRDQGMQIEPAFVEAFGVNLGDLRGVLFRYVAHSMKLLTIDITPAEVTPQVRQLAPAEVAALIGRLCLQVGKDTSAERYLEAALALNENNAMAMAGLAPIRAREQRGAEATRFYQRAIELEPRNVLHRLDVAEAVLGTVHDGVPEDLRRAKLDFARAQLQQAREIAPDNVEMLQAYATAFEDVDALKRAGELVPYNPYLKLRLARSHAEAGRFAEARRLSQLLLIWAYRDDSVERIRQAREFIEWIDQLEHAQPADASASEELGDPHRQP